MSDLRTKMVNGLLPDGTLIRACEVTFGHLEKQDDRIAKLEAALRMVVNWDSTLDFNYGPDWGEIMEIARKALGEADD